jgi:multidrug efflux pump subunit AcrA (membrane-fusion protein)
MTARIRLFVAIGSSVFLMAFGACRSDKLTGEFPPNPCPVLVALCVQPTSARVAWTSSDSLNVKVDSAGRVRAAGVSAGAGVCATSDGGSACATVTVAP